MCILNQILQKRKRNMVSKPSDTRLEKEICLFLDGCVKCKRGLVDYHTHELVLVR